MKRSLRIVSRQSKLALWQAEFVQQKLQALHPNLPIEIIGIQSKGDKNVDIPLYEFGDKGVFVADLEGYLLNDTADIAVHSVKDMPNVLPKDLELAAILQREDPREVFVSVEFPTLESLPARAIIGTSSLTRQSQIRALRPDLSITFLRGAVDNRISQLQEGKYDAMILAVAGLKRLGLTEYIQQIFEPAQLLPSVGQGALGIECRKNDKATKRLLQPLHHLPTARCVLAERKMEQRLETGSELPIAGLANITPDGNLRLQGLVASPDGRRILKTSHHGKPDTLLTIGEIVAEQLIALGAHELLCTS